ncbi:hypothetical protein Sinac_2203 [Singulisphaera acidiphila DSM 18658]|uniref:Uncharacterized protein n=1 Tax=Singulisphaera acidiphila (strain ATCC BAA-1392 / DSM 18658 / VKM B-2454 / MOB10) TaxID=886293 RepID=L0DAW7_SINAD|nr:hypothetical protein Sinac_2203 [Singulisphaera acidiphila DSM 18658]
MTASAKSKSRPTLSIASLCRTERIAETFSKTQLDLFIGIGMSKDDILRLVWINNEVRYSEILNSIASGSAVEASIKKAEIDELRDRNAASMRMTMKFYKSRYKVEFTEFMTIDDFAFRIRLMTTDGHP